MNKELQDAIGEAAYKVLERDLHHPESWDKLPEEKKEITKRVAEAAVEAYKRWIDEHAGGWLKIAGIDERENP